MTKDTKIILGYLGLLGVYVGAIVGLLVGWVFNIIDLVGGHADMAMTEFILRLVGIPVPILGAIMGYFV